MLATNFPNPRAYRRLSPAAQFAPAFDSKVAAMHVLFAFSLVAFVLLTVDLLTAPALPTRLK